MAKLFSRNSIYPVCNRVDLSCCFLRIEEAETFVRKECNDFLKTHKGLSYLCMKYPNFLASEAVNEYINTALWINSIV